MHSTLLVDESTLPVLPTLACQIGLREAIVLQRIHYWLNPKLNKNFFQGCHWVHNTYEQWQKQFPFWGERTIRRIIRCLEVKKFIHSFVSRSLENTKYYTINYESLKTVILPINNSIGLNRDKLSSKRDQQNAGINSTRKSKLVIRGEQNKKATGQNGIATGQNEIATGQNVHEQTANLANASGQNVYDQTSKLASSLKETNNTQRYILPPPLTPPPSDQISQKEEGKKEEFYQNMIDVWNSQVQAQLDEKIQKVHLKKVHFAKLKELLSEVFHDNPAEWNAYCSRISTCRFLMGESPSGFRVTLDWAMKQENARKVLDGEIYDKQQANTFKEKPWPMFEQELIEHCIARNSPEESLRESWIKISKFLVFDLGQAVFTSWFWDMSPQLSQNSIYLSVKSTFVKDYITTHYKSALEEALKAVFPDMTNFEIYLGDSNAKT